MAQPFEVDFVMDLPYHQKESIFLQLSGQDLENSRCVSSAWKFFLDNWILNSRGCGRRLRERLEENWKNQRYTMTIFECDVEFPFHVDAMSTKLVCMRTPKNIPLQSAVVRILDVTTMLFWDIPDLFVDIHRFSQTNFSVCLSDSLVAITTMLRTYGAPVYNFQVFNVKTRSKVADYNLMNLLHCHASQTKESQDTLILFRGWLIHRKTTFNTGIFHTNH